MSTTVCFRVEGEAIVRIARHRAWLDQERGHARRILACIDGLPKEAYSKILDGDATLTGDSSVGVRLLEEPDPEWKKTVAERKKWLRSKRRRDWLRRESDVSMVSVGVWRVPKHLIEQYVLVITRLKAGAFLGVSGAFAGSPLAFLDLEERRVAIHDEIMDILGLDREGEQGEEFTRLLHEKYGLFAKGDDT